MYLFNVNLISEREGESLSGNRINAIHKQTNTHTKCIHTINDDIGWGRIR